MITPRFINKEVLIRFLTAFFMALESSMALYRCAATLGTEVIIRFDLYQFSTATCGFIVIGVALLYTDVL